VKKQKVMQKVNGRISESFRKLRSKVSSQWENIRKKFDGWKSKWFRFGRKAGNNNWMKDERKEEQMSSPNSDNKDNWHREWISFQPDLHLHETFFSGRWHDWYKHEGRLIDAMARLQEMDEVSSTTLTDTEVKEIYSRVHHLSDDCFNHKTVPKQLKNWLTCQDLWWRNRLRHVKRPSRDVMECGVQLLEWQVRILCRQYSEMNGKPMKMMTNICDLFPARSVSDESQNDRGNSQETKHHEEDDEINQHEGEYSPQLFYDMEFQSERREKSSDETINFNEQNETETDVDRYGHLGDDPSWYFDRMTTREDGRHDPSWYLKAMNRDEWKHSADWYVEAMKQSQSRRAAPEKCQHNKGGRCEPMKRPRRPHCVEL